MLNQGVALIDSGLPFVFGGCDIVQKTNNNSPSKTGNESIPDKAIPENIPLTQGLKEYFEKSGITVEDIPNLSLIFERYLYVKGLNTLHEIILSLEDKITNSYNSIGDWENPTLDELIDTIADETALNSGVFKHSLIYMALKK